MICPKCFEGAIELDYDGDGTAVCDYCNIHFNILLKEADFS